MSFDLNRTKFLKNGVNFEQILPTGRPDKSVNTISVFVLFTNFLYVQHVNRPNETNELQVLYSIGRDNGVGSVYMENVSAEEYHNFLTQLNAEYTEETPYQPLPEPEPETPAEEGDDSAEPEESQEQSEESTEE